MKAQKYPEKMPIFQDGTPFASPPLILSCKAAESGQKKKARKADKYLDPQARCAQYQKKRKENKGGETKITNNKEKKIIR